MQINHLAHHFYVVTLYVFRGFTTAPMKEKVTASGIDMHIDRYKFIVIILSIDLKDRAHQDFRLL